MSIKLFNTQMYDFSYNKNRGLVSYSNDVSIHRLFNDVDMHFKPKMR